MDVVIELPVQVGPKRPEQTSSQRRALYEFLLESSQHGKLPKKVIKMASVKFLVSTRTVSRIWAQGRKSLDEGALEANVSSRKKGTVGRNKKEIDLAAIAKIPLRHRTNIRSLANAMKVSPSTLHNRIKEGLIRAHSSAVKPFLTDANKLTRLQYVLSMVEPLSANTLTPNFREMYDTIHVDEKWFYLTKTTVKYYLAKGEPEPHRTCKSKRFITKVMFLAAVARPRWDSSRNQWFDGRLGIWPFVYQEPAKRRT
jgi:hypothetical protein